MQENLLGFVLGALDADEQRELAAQLERDPELRAQLEKMQAHTAPLAHDEAHLEPPANLASNTCALVLEYADREVTLAKSSAEQALAGQGASRRWSISDLCVAAGICAAAAFLFFPAIAHSRFQAQLSQCQNNLRQLGIASQEYAARFGHFVHVPTSGKQAVAGLYGPILVEHGFVESPQALLCASSPLAGRPGEFRVPTLAELEAADGETLRVMHRTLGGSYGYTLGYVEQGQYRPNCNLNREHFALLADAPSRALPRFRSANHSARGQNVLFESGRVHYLVNCTDDSCSDELYLSDRGLVEPGRHANDAVIAASETSPLLNLAP